MNQMREQLESRRKELMQEIENTGLWIEGTLVATERRCGKNNCACHRDGPKHPVLFITWKEAGKTVSLYVPRKLESEVKVWAENYKRLKELIWHISEVQKEIVRLRE